ncbi:MAG: hypothetical protein ACTSUA_06165 [Candidatus Heimdallarchaeota archaeon]|nr:MAG: hypothetical protein DRP02_07570 [Candidatus Gerdarchaeota archaeon]
MHQKKERFWKMVDTSGSLTLAYYFLYPIEYAFFYLIPFFVLFALCSALWLIYWYYEQKPKIANKDVLRVLSTAVILSLLALGCSIFGYLIMYAGNKSLSTEVGFSFVIIAMILFPVLFVLFLIYFSRSKTTLTKKRDASEETDS